MLSFEPNRDRYGPLILSPRVTNRQFSFSVNDNDHVALKENRDNKLKFQVERQHALCKTRSRYL